MKKILFSLIFLAQPVLAQQDPVLALRDASHLTKEATAALALAETQEGRAGALTKAILSLERELTSLRLALRESIAVEEEKKARLADSRTDLGRFLATLATLQNVPPVLSVLHPDGAVASAGAGIILAAIAPKIRARADHLRGELEAIAAVNETHEQAIGSVQQVPDAGLVRFIGNFPEYGQVVILEPTPEQLQIYAGFGQVYVNTGDVLESGAAMGLLGGEMPDFTEFLAERGGENDKGTESLYIEIRENGIPVDPLSRFAIN